MAAQFALLASDGVAGWKVATTSSVGLAHIGVGCPLAGRLLARHVYAGGSAFRQAGSGKQVAGPVFVFRFATAQSPRATPYTSEDVLVALTALHLGIEVRNSRHVDFGQAREPQLFADDTCAHDFVLGPASPGGWRTPDLAWLVNDLCSRGIGLLPGQFETGTYMAPLDLLPGYAVVADIGVLGNVTARFMG